MSTLIRFEQSSNRRPSTVLWGNLVDWVRGTLAASNTVFIGGDHYNSGDQEQSGDTGGAAAVVAGEGGRWSETATSAADAVAGHLQNLFVDLDDSNVLCTQVRLSRTDDDASSITFVGFTDEVLDGIFGTDNTLDGASLGLIWNADETVDLISVSASDVITVLIAEVATGVLRTDGFHSFGVKFVKLNSTQAQVFAQVNSTVKKVTALLTALPTAAMRPAVIFTNDNESAPLGVIDWHFTLDKFAA